MNLEEKKKFFQLAKKKKACKDAIEWIEKTGIENVTYENIPANFALWAVGEIGLPCTDEQFDHWGDRAPWTAIQYAHARCTDEQFNRWGDREPWAALVYALARCTDEQFDHWGDRAPWTAIQYAHARCTDEQFNRWGDREPGTAIQYAHDRCTDEQFDRWGDLAPGAALEISIKLLNNNNIKYQKRNNGYHLIIVEGGIIINFWPSTGKFISRNKTGRGVFNLLKYIKKCKMSK